ncbi:MAG: MFS transporter, partial [Pseudomonadota bacterium]
SAYWALLPLIAREAEGGGSELYGMLMALIGGGAVLGAFVLPKLQSSITSDMTVKLGTLGTVAALLIIAVSNSTPALMLASVFGGLSWIAVLTSFNVSAQTALPDWVRARGLAVFLMVFFGSMSLGSIVWGQVATVTGISLTMVIAACGLVFGILLTQRFKVGQGEDLDLSSMSVWPDAPALPDGYSSDRPAMVTIEYEVETSKADAFLEALKEFAEERMRDGAIRWDVHESVENPGTWIETFHLPSWQEHLEQHNRLTANDADQHAKLQAFDKRTSGPVVRHYVSS